MSARRWPSTSWADGEDAASATSEGLSLGRTDASTSECSDLAPRVPAVRDLSDGEGAYGAAARSRHPDRRVARRGRQGRVAHSPLRCSRIRLRRTPRLDGIGVLFATENGAGRHSFQASSVWLGLRRARGEIIAVWTKTSWRRFGVGGMDFSAMRARRFTPLGAQSPFSVLKLSGSSASSGMRGRHLSTTRHPAGSTTMSH